ncbi:retrovirus-related pol polyprotein from transposon TNT 1-94 [Tanacetum coccineum]
MAKNLVSPVDTTPWARYQAPAYRKAPKCSEKDLSDTRRSTSGSIQLLGDRLVSWSSKRQKSAEISSTEAEYIALSGCCPQVLWMRSQLTTMAFDSIKSNVQEIHKSAIAYAATIVQHSRSKHIDIRTNGISTGAPETIYTEKALGRERNEFLTTKLGKRSFTPDTSETIGR